ncbi:hypothetical protein APY94_12120 [Thermococcus celericrescens]|uniref:Uncharacterized protein n=1 Tax=Thermococcus celericrescens TaxID=227598 RepID=A0A100XW45_9EURY|nr:hypothetical protein [Thermococcus celericrescens]KUH31683.1 hypothetical protein APY94_12120 [Thermococcus celericrescens]
MDEWERTAKVLLDNAREFLERLRDEVRLNEVTLASLLEVQSTFVLGLADASLYAFPLGRDDVIEGSYRLFLEGLDVLKAGHLLVSEPELDLWLSPLRELNPERGFSLDRRFSLLSEPKPTMVWANRVVQLRNALHGRPVRDPLRSIGYGIDKGGRRFPVLLKAVRRLYTLYPASIDETARLLALELGEGLDGEPLECSDGTCEEIAELPDVLAFIKTVSGDVELYYLIENSKDLHSPWGSLSVGRAREIVVFSRKKGKGFRLREAP